MDCFCDGLCDAGDSLLLAFEGNSGASDIEGEVELAGEDVARVDWKGEPFVECRLSYQISPDQLYLVNTLGIKLLCAKLNDHIAFWTDQVVAVASLIARATERERKSRANKTEEEDEAKRKSFLERRTGALKRAWATSSLVETERVA